MLKYEYNADYYSSHEQIVRVLAGLPAGSRILDVGAAQGYLGERLKGLGYHLTGIERDKESADVAAKHYNEFMTCDLESDELRLDGPYDAIVLADVLEHLRDSMGTLLYFKQQLNVDGIVIVSVPNVANISVRLSLLLGRFDYQERGILDRGHLRFFTFESLRAMTMNVGLSVKSFMVTPIPLPLILPMTAEGRSFHFLHVANRLLSKVWKEMFGYQFIVVARANDKRGAIGPDHA